MDIFGIPTMVALLTVLLIYISLRTFRFVNAKSAPLSAGRVIVYGGLAFIVLFMGMTVFYFATGGH